MRLKISLSLLILSMMPALLMAQEPAWLVRLKQQKWMEKVIRLKLLATNRIEAEKILGKPNDSKTENLNPIEFYSPSEGEVTLNYTTKECTSTEGKIAKDTIEEISFYPKADIPFSKLKLPLNQFKRISSDVVGAAWYRNEKRGVNFSVHSDNTIESVNFEITEQKNFSCVTVSSFLSDLEKLRNLKLLEANREDVRRIFAEYKKSTDFEGSQYKDKYYTGDATIEFVYAQGKCLFEDSDEYDSTEWNVERINISPINHIIPQEFGFKLAQYKKEQVYQNVNDLFVYHDKNAGISFRISDGKIFEINLFPPPKYNSLMCDKKQVKTLSATDSLFTEKLKDRIFPIDTIASVKNLYLSKSEIIASDSFNQVQDESAQDDAQKIIVLTKADNPRGDVLTYSYTVTVGKIRGQGEKVVWDLSGVKAGTYTITAAVDDGCGFCGTPKTKTVIVKDN